MEISRVKIRLRGRPTNPNVLASAAFQAGDFLAVKDLRIIRRADGRLIVQFPERPHLVRCHHCDLAVGIAWDFCRHCGGRQPGDAEDRLAEANVDDSMFQIVHPISHFSRQAIERPILEAFLAECRRDGAA